ncbi:hypothetical protein D3C72_1973290 [compost metagenome]
MRPADFGKLQAGVPHQRAICKHPQVVPAFGHARKHLAARAFDVAVGQAPIDGQALAARLRVPFRQDLVGQPQSAGVGGDEPSLKFGKVHKGRGRHVLGLQEIVGQALL